MKNCAVFVILALMVIGGDALPFGHKPMIYYQQQPAAAQYYAAPQPQRMMYMHYMQPGYGNARSMQAASALVAGQHVATGTYLEDCIPAEGDTAAGAAPSPQVQHGEDVLGDAGVHSAHSVAEAYPDDSDVAAPAPPPPSRSQTVEDEQPTAVVDVPVEDETQTPIESDDEAKVPRVYNFEKNEPAAEAELPAPAPIAPVASSAIVPPARRYLPSKKKVYVELDEAAAVEEPDTENAVATVEDEENNEEDEETDVAAVVPVVPQKPRRPAAKKPVKPVKPVKAAADCSGCAKANADCDSPCARAGSAGSSKPTSKPHLPAGTFFPIDFGGTTGGAIAIANSFSTGEGGSATSHAMAYGSPESVRARVKPSKLH